MLSFFYDFQFLFNQYLLGDYSMLYHVSERLPSPVRIAQAGFFTYWMLFLSPNQQHRSTGGKKF